MIAAMAAGLLAFGFGTARADVGAPPTPTNSNDITDTVPQVPARVDANGNPLPPGDADVGVNPAAPPPVPPAAGAPGTVETAPAGSATMPSGADVNVNPPAPPPPAVVQPVRPLTPGVRPPARVIDTNSAAITGAVVEPEAPVVPPFPPRNAYYEHGVMHDTTHTWVGRVGAGLMVGGGYEDFTNSNVRSMTGGGGAWNARAVAGTRQFVGVEAAYVGAARSIDALGLGSSAVLLSNGVEGNVRVNVPIVMRRAQLLEPFGFVGLGWQHYQVTNTNVNVATSDVARNDDVMSVPVGGGLGYAIGRFMADARVTYRATYYNDLMRTGGSLNNWGVGTQIGFAF